MKIKVLAISESETVPFMLKQHYARRRCSVSFAFGAYRGADLIGIVTYGVPVSSPLREGICGKQWASHVLELNRLCCENSANIASQLVGRSLRLLPKPSIIVSYADTSQGHVGYVYQSCNFVYTGLSAKRTNWTIRGQEHLHGASVADKSRGQKNRAQYMRDTYGADFYLSERPRKHRYVFFCGSKKDVKLMKGCLLYPIQNYPKGESLRYEISSTVETQRRLLFDE